jgi:hypothetical protein
MEDEFTSGPWTGFYTYSDGRRERMDLSLSFREGVVSGAGRDPVGPFGVLGRYDAETNGIYWTKTYVGRHSVFYKGCRDTRGIWGTWEIPPSGHGGFHIWPEGRGPGRAEALKVETEEADLQSAARKASASSPSESSIGLNRMLPPRESRTMGSTSASETP